MISGVGGDDYCSFDNGNDNDNILFDHNIEIELIMYKFKKSNYILVWRLLTMKTN